jgi:hypothetical protein
MGLEDFERKWTDQAYFLVFVILDRRTSGYLPMHLLGGGVDHTDLQDPTLGLRRILGMQWIIARR